MKSADCWWQCLSKAPSNVWMIDRNGVRAVHVYFGKDANDKTGAEDAEKALRSC